MSRPKIILPLLAAAAGLAIAAPADAQMSHGNMPGMNMPGMKMPAPAKKKPAAKKTVVKKAAAKKSPSNKSSAKKAASKKSSAKKPTTAGHDMSAMPGMEMPAGHDMSTMPGMEMPAGHDMSQMPEQAAPETSMPSGHDMSNMPGMTMPGHDMADMPQTPAGTDLPPGNAPAPPVPTDRAADAVYGADAMHMGRHHLEQFHGGQRLFQALVNVAEAQFRKGPDGFEWDGEAWFGGDIHRLWLKSQGEGQFDRAIDRAEVQALYSKAFSPYFNWQAGLRYDFKPNPSRVYATVGVEGLAPSFFDVEGAVFLSNKGEVMARAEGYYDQRITQRLILQPRVELNFAAQNSREIGVGAGLSDAEVGLRLRYDIRREFAPYMGVQYGRAFGRTRDYLRDEGEDAGSWSLLTGVRMWL